jgi:hypothetical protein
MPHTNLQQIAHFRGAISGNRAPAGCAEGVLPERVDPLPYQERE